MGSRSGPKAPAFMEKESGIGSGSEYRDWAVADELLMAVEFNGRVRGIGFALATRLKNAKRCVLKNICIFRPCLKRERKCIARARDVSQSLQCLSYNTFGDWSALFSVLSACTSVHCTHSPQPANSRKSVLRLCGQTRDSRLLPRHMALAGTHVVGQIRASPSTLQTLSVIALALTCTALPISCRIDRAHTHSCIRAVC